MPLATRLTVVSTCAVARTRSTRRPLTRSSFLHHVTEPTPGAFRLNCYRLMINIGNSDTPISLLLAAMQAIPEVTETLGTGLNFSLFTGDLTAHDSDNQYSR